MAQGTQNYFELFSNFAIVLGRHSPNIYSVTNVINVKCVTLWMLNPSVVVSHFLRHEMHSDYFIHSHIHKIQHIFIYLV